MSILSSLRCHVRVLAVTFFFSFFLAIQTIISLRCCRVVIESFLGRACHRCMISYYVHFLCFFFCSYCSFTSKSFLCVVCVIIVPFLSQRRVVSLLRRFSCYSRVPISSPCEWNNVSRIIFCVIIIHLCVTFVSFLVHSFSCVSPKCRVHIIFMPYYNSRCVSVVLEPFSGLISFTHPLRPCHQKRSYLLRTKPFLSAQTFSGINSLDTACVTIFGDS